MEERVKNAPKILYLLRLKASRDDKINVAQVLEFVLERIEKNWKKCLAPTFSPFCEMLSKAVFLGFFKSLSCVIGYLRY